MEKIKGNYYIKLNTNYGFALPGDADCCYRFWTDRVIYEEDNSITFEPINTTFNKEVWPKAINIHISNCVIFKMKT